MDSRIETRAALELPGAHRTRVTVTRIAWHGWPECYLIANGGVEAVVVPAIGRVMQLRVAGETDETFWEDRALNGQPREPAPDRTDASEWINFGGDKCWPAPQSDWLRQQGRDWPPPAGFDSRPMEAVAGERGVVLTSSVDPAFGIQVRRQVELDAELPVMRIRTEFRKIVGDAVRVGVWTITQMREPERVFFALREESKMPGGYVRLTEAEPEGLRIEDGLLSLVRPRLHCTKIGTDATCMAWVGAASVVRIDTEDGPGEYPDGGCITQVYTNPDPLPYVELETLGPLTTMSVGDRIERTTVYRITPRSAPDPEAEARKIFCS